MPWLSFDEYPLWVNFAIFAGIAGGIWLIGTRLTIYADLIADRTGLGKAFVGGLFLATATSLPELGRTVAAGVLGEASLAVDSLLGGIAQQTSILAVADIVVGQAALTYMVPRPVLLLEGALLVVLIALAMAGMAASTLLVLFGVGLWTAILFAAYILMLYLLRRYEDREQWMPVEVARPRNDVEVAEPSATARLVRGWHDSCTHGKTLSKRRQG